MKEVSFRHLGYRRVGNIAVITPRGNLVGGDETDELGQLLNDLILKGTRCLVVNFKNVEFITSIALGVFAHANATYRNRKGEIVLCHLDDRVNNIFAVTRLILLFDHYETEEKSIAALAVKEDGCPGW